MSDIRIDPPIQVTLSGNGKRHRTRYAIVKAESEQPSQVAPELEIVHPQTNTVSNTMSETSRYPHGHNSNADHCAPHQHVVSYPATYPVNTGSIAGTQLTKDVLRIGADSYDLTNAVLGSADFKYKLLAWLSDVLAGDRNVQYAVADLMADSQATQDKAIAAVTHAVSCAYYENGALVFPNLENNCGKVNRIQIPPVDGIKYDSYTATLTIGMASVQLDVNAIVAKGLQAAMNAATETFGAPRQASDIDSVFVGTADQCNPAKVADIDQFAQAILENGIPALCEQNKLKEQELPSRLLAFGKSCRDFGYTTITSLLKQLNASLPLAAKGELPLELRGFKFAEAQAEQRYPVRVRKSEPIVTSGAIVAAGDSSKAPVMSSSVSVTATVTGLYLVSGYTRGFLTLDKEAALNKGIVHTDLRLSQNGNLVYVSGDNTYFDAASTMINSTIAATCLMALNAGDTVSMANELSGGGLVATDANYAGVLGIQPISQTVLDINP